MGNVFSAKKPSRSDFEATQPDEDLRSRYLAVIDKYLTDKGMTNYIPAESRPYELRSAEERGAWRNATGAQLNEMGGVKKPSLNDGVRFDNLSSQNIAPASVIPQSGNVFKDFKTVTPERQVSSQAIAPTTSAPQASAVPLTANTAFFQEDQRRKQEEYDRVRDYIYRDQRSR